MYTVYIYIYLSLRSQTSKVTLYLINDTRLLQNAKTRENTTLFFTTPWTDFKKETFVLQNL